MPAKVTGGLVVQSMARLPNGARGEQPGGAGYRTVGHPQRLPPPVW